MGEACCKQAVIPLKCNCRSFRLLMKLNLDTLKNEIDAHLKQSGFIVFYGFPRTDMTPEIDWDTTHYPDYKMFLNVAKQLDVKLVVLHQRQFNAAIIDRAIEELQS